MHQFACNKVHNSLLALIPCAIIHTPGNSVVAHIIGHRIQDDRNIQSDLRIHRVEIHGVVGIKHRREVTIDSIDGHLNVSQLGDVFIVAAIDQDRILPSGAAILGYDLDLHLIASRTYGNIRERIAADVRLDDSIGQSDLHCGALHTADHIKVDRRPVTAHLNRVEVCLGILIKVGADDQGHSTLRSFQFCQAGFIVIAVDMELVILLLCAGIIAIPGR